MNSFRDSFSHQSKESRGIHSRFFHQNDDLFDSNMKILFKKYNITIALDFEIITFSSDNNGAVGKKTVSKN